MATLTVEELAFCRQQLRLAFQSGTFSKQNVNNAMQAIEDAFVTNAIGGGHNSETLEQYLSGVIDTATSPFTFTNAEKKKIFAYWALKKYGRDG